eukprot:TRINITY_DN14639_c0_g1_i1.p1 TRINITY_DN14639_c0_g1~~TRINITY_DN14639_c0_g1_i1.p1  ORF type:complete len:441 (+),score=70.05 TRINITY_DN14639_c0_g1_i1:140-1462(+)
MLRRCSVLKCTGRVIDITVPSGLGQDGKTYYHMEEKGQHKKFNARKELAKIRGELKIKSRGEMLVNLAEVIWGTCSTASWEDSAANVTHEIKGWESLPEIAIIGTSFTGKSTLLRELFAPRKHISDKSSLPGNKSQINFFRVANSLRLLETPGYGYTAETLKVQHQWQNAVLCMVKTRVNLKHIYLLCNIKPKGFTERDRSMIEFLTLHGVNFTIVVTRADRFLSGFHNNGLLAMSAEERYEKMLKFVHDLKREANADKASVIITSAKDGQGLGHLMYDFTARAFDTTPTEELFIENVTQTRRQEVVEHEGGEGGEDNFTSLIKPSTWLPPAHLPEGFFYSHAHAVAQRVPKRESTAIAMLTPEDEAASDNYHPLKGNPLLKRYFPTLAEIYLRQNHADLNPTVKPKAEEYFGMPLPTKLHMKYSTPEEKEKWRKLLNKP